MSGLPQVLDAAQALWSLYLAKGPGQLTPKDSEPFEAALAQLRMDKFTPKDAKLCHECIPELTSLLRRCVERTEGLCFVTGEAGLIPRKDLHEKCDSLLMLLASISDS